MKEGVTLKEEANLKEEVASKSKIRSNKKKYIIATILILIFVACFIPNPPKYNSKYKLNIVSPYGDDEAYHPKVLNFKNEWNGYKYWMSYTPYPKGNDVKENPCIVASNDLIHWKEPAGLKNPLDIPEDVQTQKRYNSDAHIVYNDILDRMECYWRYVDDVKNQSIIYRKCTTDGIHWSDKEISAVAKPRKQKKDYVSPAILFENGMYKMWYVDKNNTVTYETSKDGLHWENRQVIKIKYEEKLKTWHLDVIRTENGYEMITVAYENWRKHNDMSLYYTNSKDGINWTTAKVILKPTTGTEYWDNKGLYRSSFIYEDGVYYLYYGGTSHDMHHGIGFMYGKDIFNLKSVKVDYKNEEQTKQLEKEINKI